MTDLDWIIAIGSAICVIGAGAILRNEFKHDVIMAELKGHNDRVMDKLIAIWTRIGGE